MSPVSHLGNCVETEREQVLAPSRWCKTEDRPQEVLKIFEASLDRFLLEGSQGYLVKKPCTIDSNPGEKKSPLGTCETHYC